MVPDYTHAIGCTVTVVTFWLGRSTAWFPDVGLGDSWRASLETLVFSDNIDRLARRPFLPCQQPQSVLDNSWILR